MTAKRFYNVVLYRWEHFLTVNIVLSLMERIENGWCYDKKAFYQVNRASQGAKFPSLAPINYMRIPMGTISFDVSNISSRAKNLQNKGGH